MLKLSSSLVVLALTLLSLSEARWTQTFEVVEKNSPSIDDLSMRQFSHLLAELEAAQAVNIPKKAEELGLSVLVQEVTRAGLAEALSGPGPLTVFGPTNNAFANLPGWTKKAISNITVLQDILKYHVLSGEVLSSSLKNELTVATLEGRKLRINIYKISDSESVYTAQCSPIDLKRVDQKASNGVIHVLDKVMLPPAGNIVESLSMCPQFKTLVTAVKAAGLVTPLSGDAPLTVFAPTDAAFAKLPPGTLEKLLKNPKELAAILLYHVVSGTQCSSGLRSGAVKTLAEKDVQVDVTSAGVKVNGANVILADGSVSNGVVHAIDAVLLPPSMMLYL